MLVALQSVKTQKSSMAQVFSDVMEHATEVSFILVITGGLKPTTSWLSLYGACFITHHFLFISSTKHKTIGEEIGK